MEVSPGIIELQKAAKYIADNLAESVWKKNVMHSHDLYSSINWKLVENTIHILYNYYGLFPELGVGKGVPLGMVGYKGLRKPKKWYSKTIYREVARLAEYTARVTGLRVSEVVGEISEVRSATQTTIPLTL